MRILVTGSRDWWPPSTVYQWLTYYSNIADSLIVVHGACPTGADRAASRWAKRHANDVYPIIEEAHPAKWRPYGIYNPQAGIARNREMVDLGADACLAFIRNGSRGATQCAELAEAAGIPTRRFTT